MLTAGRVDPLVFQAWAVACRRFMKNAEKKPTEIVSYVADAMLEPRLMGWYQADHTRIDTLSLEEYLVELAILVLEKTWAHDVRTKILASKQGNKLFIDWKIELENLNAILTTNAPTYALTAEALKLQLEANLNDDL
ncbi:hypothetical protein M422DRAFT_142230, partial [Sphaerobolus stellatus SS14]